MSRLRIERQKRDGDYGGAEEDGEDYDDNDDSNMGDGNDDDFSWPAADVSATGAIFDSCRRVYVLYRDRLKGGP